MAALACGVPVQVFAVLHVEQHGWDQFVHVLRLPDDGLQLVVHRLPHHALQTLDPGHTDPDGHTAEIRETQRKGRTRHTSSCGQKFTSLITGRNVMVILGF